MVNFINFTALKYMVTVSAICACYALVAVSCSWLRLFVAKAWIFFVSDQVIAYLIVSSGAAVMETLYIAYNGDQQVSWSEACQTYGSFCNKLKIALIVHALALCCFLVLAVISAFRAFSQFDPPFIPSQEGRKEAKKEGDQESKC